MATWDPTPADVHALIPQRNNGRPFDATSTPTVDQVTLVAGQVVAEIEGEVGTVPAEPRWENLARRAAALGAAAQVELSLYPEQGAYGADSAQGTLFAAYRRNVEALRAGIAALQARPATAGSIRLGLPDWSGW